VGVRHPLHDGADQSGGVNHGTQPGVAGRERILGSCDTVGDRPVWINNPTRTGKCIDLIDQRDAQRAPVDRALAKVRVPLGEPDHLGS
jgi:hypothetical protein